MKVLLNASIDSEIIDWARNNIDNVSAFLEDALRAEKERIEKREAITPEKEAEIVGWLEKIARVKEIEIELLKIQAIYHKRANDAKFAEIIELEGVRPDQAANTDFMLGLVTVLREKYPALARVDLKQLRDYLETREATA